MKRCPKCQTVKPHAEFPVSKGKVYGYCLPCHAEYQREWMRKRRGRVT